MSNATGMYSVRMACSSEEPGISERMCYSGEYSFKRGDKVKILRNNRLVPHRDSAVDAAIALLQKKGIIKEGKIVNL